MPPPARFNFPIVVGLMLPIAAFQVAAAPRASIASPADATAHASSIGRRPAPPAAGRHRCVTVAHMAGAVVIGDRAVELTMVTGQRWRMAFARDCPALSFYQGFYYRRSQQGVLCAGRDAVVARSGGACPIASIIALSPLRRR